MGGKASDSSTSDDEVTYRAEGDEAEDDEFQDLEEFRYENSNWLIGMYVDFREDVVSRPKQLPLGTLAHYAPFVHAVVMYLWRVVGKGVVGVVVGAVLYGVTSLLVWPVFGSEPVITSASGLVEMVGGATMFVVTEAVERPWVVWFWVAVAYVVFQYYYQYYLERMADDEEMLWHRIQKYCQTEEERQRNIEKWLRPKNRSIRMKERMEEGAPPLWRELVLWSLAGVLLGAHVVLLRTEFVTVSYLADVPLLAVEAAYLVVAVLVSRTLMLTLVEDRVRFPTVATILASGWRAAARLPLMYAAFTYLVGQPYWWGAFTSAVVFSFTPVVGLAYVVRRSVVEWQSSELTKSPDEFADE